MADRNRRKSSILKIPKTRAPLQDVNSLDVKSSSEDDITSHTALRRRVSFAGKNFVKEFCAEAEIASVFHAPEYEQLLVTSSNSSTSSNITHSDTVSDTNSTLQNRTQSSVYRSISIQDDYDPCEQILRDYQGNNSTQLTTGQSNPVRKTRFSFGEIKIQTDESENEISSVSPSKNQAQAQHVEFPAQKDQGPNGNNNLFRVNPEEFVNHDTLLAPLPSTQNLPSSTICGNAESNFEKPFSSSTMEVHPVDATRFRDKTRDFSTGLPVIIQTNSFPPNVNEGKLNEQSRESKKTVAPSIAKVFTDTCHQEIAQPTSMELRRAPTEIREMLSCEDEKMVESIPSLSKTYIMSSTMDLTTALPSVIRENPVGFYSDNEMMESENVPSHSKTQIMCSSMEFTTTLPTNIQTHLQENDIIDENIANYEENHTCSNKTVAMSTTMEFTSALPSNIREDIHHNSKNDPRENPAGYYFYKNNMESENAPSHSNSEIMCTSMEFTTALPSNIRTHIQGNDIIDKSIGNYEENHICSNKTVAMSTTMELTTAMPSNIIDNGIHYLPKDYIGHCSDKVVIESENVTEHSKTKIMCPNKTVAMSTTMEFTTAMPSNIRENVIHHYSIDDKRENSVGHHSNENMMESENVPSLSKTQIMCTSMEFTSVLPTNMQTNLQESDKIGVIIENDEENHKCPNKTNVFCTTMEFTTAMPSCIRQNLVQVEHLNKTNVSLGNNEESNIPLNNANAVPTSMEISTQLAFDTRENAACQVSSDEVLLVENSSPHSRTFLVTGVAGGIGIQQEGNVEASLNVDHCDEFMPLLPQAINASMMSQKSMASNTAGNLENSHYLSSRGPDVCHSEITYSSEDCLRENVPDSELRCEGQAIRPMTEVSVFNLEGSNKVHYFNTPVAQQENNANKLDMSYHKITTSHHSDANAQVVPKQGEKSLSADQILKASAPLSDPRGDLDSALNPFQSRPRLLSSPSKQGGIESVMVQTSQSQVVLNVATETCPPVDNRVTLNKSAPLNVFDRKETKLAVSGEEQDKLVKYQSDSALAPPSREKNDFDPFKSRPCLISSPVTADAAVVQTILNTQANTVEPCESSVVKDINVNGVLANNRKSLGDGPLFDILARDCNMLQDEPPPFHDCPSNVTLEISGNVMDNSVIMLHSHLKSAETVQVLSPQIQSEVKNVRISEHFSEQMECEPNVCVEPSTSISECHKDENSGSEIKRTISADNCRLARRSCGSTVQSEGCCSDKSTPINSSKRIRDLSQENSGTCQVESLNRPLSKRIRNSSWESQVAGPSTLPLSRLCESFNRVSYNSDVDSSNASLSSNVGLSIDDIIFKSQMKHPQYWNARKNAGTDLWTFKFKGSLLELRVHLKDTPLVDGNIEAHSGYFHSNVNDSTKPIIWWGMKILTGTLSTTEWTSRLRHSSNFMDTLQQIVVEVAPVRSFIVETMIQEGTEKLKISRDSLYFDVVSSKCHLWFKVNLKLDSWENFTPDHISVNNVVGNTRESEVKNLITGVKKDIYFLRNYIRDVKDYVRTLEEFCK